jgi:serine/threonine-protein kinase
MNESYLARDTDIDQLVVLKLPHPHLIGDLTTYSRFEREIAIGQRLHHPNIQLVLGSGRLPGGSAPYIVTEYVEGDSLRAFLDDRKPLPIPEAISLTRQIVAALTYCHAEGVVHRDLKPENILITPAGQIKLMDFGIALLQGARRVTWGSLSSAVGTPDYMAPEQVRGERGDERTDVYAVGIILFEMLAGEVPFHGDNPLAVLSLRVHQDAPLVTEFRADVPAPLAYLVSRAIQRAPTDRHPTIAALGHDLDHLDEVDTRVPLAATRSTSGLPSAAITIAVVALVFVALVALGIGAELLHRAQLLH